MTLSGAIDWGEFAEFFPSGTVNLKITRKKFVSSLEAWIYQEKTGIDMSNIINPASNSSQSEEKPAFMDRTFVQWRKFNKHYELMADGNLYKEKALEAFEQELTEYIEARAAGKVAKAINKEDIEIPQTLKDAVDKAYEDIGTDREMKLPNGTVTKAKYIPYPMLVGFVANYLGTEPAGYAEMMNQIKVYQQDTTAGFTPPVKGPKGGVAKISLGVQKSQVPGAVVAKKK